MEAPASSRRRVRTGLFEIDVGSGDVHKEGRRVPLQEQPFRVLAMLLERPGDVITREELQARLWPADTFVGFDEGVNTAIRSKGEFVAPSLVASVYALAGDKDGAFEWLDKAYAERDGETITLLKCDPSFNNLHGDPRFADLLLRLGMPQ